MPEYICHLFGAKCFCCPLEYVLYASSLNFMSSSGVNMLTVSHSGRNSLPCADMKFAFFIISTLSIGFLLIIASRYIVLKYSFRSTYAFFTVENDKPLFIHVPHDTAPTTVCSFEYISVCK